MQAANGRRVSPRGNAYNASRRDQSRARIAKAAAELFVSQGPSSTTVSDVAARAGVSRGLLYSYFGSWDDLVEQVVESHVHQVLTHFLAVAEGQDPAVRLAEYVTRQLDDLAVQPDLHRTWLITATDPQQSQLLRRIRRRVVPDRVQFLALLDELFADLGWPEPALTTSLFLATMQGIVFNYLVRSQADPLAGTTKTQRLNLLQLQRQYVIALFARPLDREQLPSVAGTMSDAAIE